MIDREKDSFAWFVLAGAGLVVFILACVFRLGDCFFFDRADELLKYLAVREFLDLFAGRAAACALHDLPTDFRMPFFMDNHYTGIPAVYCALAAVGLFGPLLGSFLAFKLVAVVFGALTVCCVFFVLSRLFSRRVAALSAMFLSCNWVYIYAVRCAFFREEVWQIAGLWFGLALCVRGAEGKRAWLVGSGFLVFGITLWAKVMFFAYILGFVCAWAAFGRGRNAPLKALFFSPRARLFAAMGFVLGALPLVWFNAGHGFATFFALWNRMLADAQAGGGGEWNNWNLGSNLLGRMGDLADYVSGRMFFGRFVNPFFFALALLGAFRAAFEIFFGRAGQMRARLRAVCAFYLAVLAASCFIPDRRTSGHVLVLVPWVEMLCALFLDFVPGFKSRRALASVAVAAICAAVLSGQWRGFDRYVRGPAASGEFSGLYVHERDVLLDWLAERNVGRLAAFEPAAAVLYGQRPGFEVKALLPDGEWPYDLQVFCGAKRGDAALLLVPRCAPYTDGFLRGITEKIGGELEFEIVPAGNIGFRDRRDSSFVLFRITGGRPFDPVRGRLPGREEEGAA